MVVLGSIIPEKLSRRTGQGLYKRVAVLQVDRRYADLCKWKMVGSKKEALLGSTIRLYSHGTFTCRCVYRNCQSRPVGSERNNIRNLAKEIYSVDIDVRRRFGQWK